MNKLKSPNAGNNKKDAGCTIKREVLKIGALVSFTALFPLGIMGYIAGFTLSTPLLVINLYGALFWPLVALYCLIRLPFKAISLRREGTPWTKISLLSTICVIFVVMLTIIAQFTLIDAAPGYIPAYGLRRRMEIKADIPAIRKWLEERQDTKQANLHNRQLPLSDWPECIKKLHPKSVSLQEWDEGLGVRLTFGSGMGLAVEPETMKHQPYIFNLPLCPGSYVWLIEK